MGPRAGRLLLMGALAAALSGVAACGNSTTGGPIGAPEVIIGRAPDVTMAAGTAKILITSPLANASGDINLGTHQANLSLFAPGYTKAIDLVAVGGTGYFKAPSAQTFTQLPGPVAIEALELNSCPPPSKPCFSPILPNGDPWADIDLVRGTVHILSDGGGEVDGANTIGYTLTIDPQQAIETTPVARQAAVQALLAGRTKLFTIQVWIDSLYRIRRIEVAANLDDFDGQTPPTRIDGETIASDVDFVSFGVVMSPVTVPAT